MTQQQQGLDEFLAEYADPTTTKSLAVGYSENVVLRFGQMTIVLYALEVADDKGGTYLDLDVRAFDGQQPVDLGVMAMTQGARHGLEVTGSTQQGWNAASLVALLLPSNPVVEHVIEVVPRVGPFDSRDLFIAVCSAGDYQSGPATEHRARKRGDEHVAAKQAQQQS